MIQSILCSLPLKVIKILYWAIRGVPAPRGSFAQIAKMDVLARALKPGSSWHHCWGFPYSRTGAQDVGCRPCSAGLVGPAAAPQGAGDWLGVVWDTPCLRPWQGPLKADSLWIRAMSRPLEERCLKAGRCSCFLDAKIIMVDIPIDINAQCL